MVHRETFRTRGDAASFPSLLAAAERAASEGGLGRGELLAFLLATEEVARWIAEVAAPGRETLVHFLGESWFADVEFVFEGHDLDLTPFNLTARPLAGSDPSLTATGLRIASRVVDTLRLRRERGLFRLGMTKERKFPDDERAADGVPETPSSETRPDHLAVRTATPAEGARAFLFARERYPAVHFTAGTFTPGRAATRIAAGDLFSCVAVDRAGAIAGVVFWSPPGDPLVMLRGPFLFVPGADAAIGRALFEQCLFAVARTKATGIVSLGPSIALPAGSFETLGDIELHSAPGVRSKVRVVYRQLAEDQGASVWVAPSLDPFLAAEYRRLAFARERLLPSSRGVPPGRGTVLSARINRPAHQGSLVPLLLGPDAAGVLAEFVRTLHEDGLPDVLFEMDLGIEEHALFAPALEAAGFLPRIVFPCAGEGDLLLFQHAGNPA